MTDELSLQARGALAWFRDHPDADITPQAVQELGPGVGVSYRILNELISKGFMIRHTYRNEDGTVRQYCYQLIKDVQVFEMREPVVQ